MADPVAPKKDQIKGSDENPAGSAKDKTGGIDLSEATEKSLQNKADDHNEKMAERNRPEWTRVRVGALRSVYRRGAGAFSSSHRPGIGRGQWAMARVNAFLFLARTGAPENPKYVGDYDLLHKDHPKYSGSRGDNLADVEDRAEVNLDPPEYMQESARRGIELHEEGKSGDGLMPQTVEDARKMANGSVSEGKWRKIGAWIARHMSDLNDVDEGEITGGVVAMLLWGGGSTKASARRAMEYAYGVVERLDKRDLGLIMTDTVGWVSVQKPNEQRVIAYSNLEVRATGAGNTLVGYASIFDSPSEPLPYTEYVRKGAFAKTINDGADVRLLIDHEGVPLARTTSGTMKISEDEKGLFVEADLDPNNPDAARVISAMSRGDLSQMSFAFRTIQDNWSEDRSVRELKEVQLFDVSVVTFPAYEDTIAEVRKVGYTQIVEPVMPTRRRLREVQIAQRIQAG